MSFDLGSYQDLPRLGGLALSLDGSRLVTTVAQRSPDGTAFVTSLWEVDPGGGREPRRLTRSAEGENTPTFLPDGGLLFTSRRPDPSVKEHPEDPKPALWLLPADGGEARQVAAVPSGVRTVTVARDSGAVLIGSELFPGADTLAEDEARDQARREAKVGAVLHEAYPIRMWDHELGPREPHLHLAPGLDPATGRLAEPRDLVAAPGRALMGPFGDPAYSITPDGGTVVVAWLVEEGRGRQRSDVVAIDTASGEVRTLLTAPSCDHTEVAVSPDGRWVVAARFDNGDPERAADVTLWLVDVSGGRARDLTPDLDLWPHSPVWAPGSDAVFFVADERGRAPVFRVAVATGEVTRVCADGAFSDLCPSPDGSTVYAVRSAYDAPPQPVALDATAVDGAPTLLPAPGLPLELPGRLHEVDTTADDGTPLRAWLVLPPEASADNPAPLLLWIHGGPLASWNSWSWRWNPHLMAERGYAVLLPDPALSTGYGWEFVQRAWGAWGARCWTDLLSVLDATEARPDIDGTRTAAMGGSFGGYMANWAAGHTDRFRAVVTHASLWALDQFHGTTDHGIWWENEFGSPYDDPSRYLDNSPHRFVDRITTPMLVIHGQRDDRVPVGEALRLWTDLVHHGVEAKYLYFPDENHWILKPNNATVWYETVLAFLDQHVLGKDWVRPALL